MAKTIIQTIGPLYGESVNGTVFGRPNGSIYVPMQNTIALSLVATQRYIRKVKPGAYDVYALCSSVGAISSDPALHAAYVAESQDLQNYVQLQLSDSSDFTTYAEISMNAGQYNGTTLAVSQDTTLSDLVNGDTYYLRAVLMSGSGVPVATSDTIEVSGVVL